MIEKILKKAIQRGELHIEFSDEDIEYLLAHYAPTTSGQPSKNLLPELEKILLNAISERKRLDSVSGLNEVEMAAMEKLAPYGYCPTDESHCSVGDALRETLRANGWNEKQAAEKLGISEQVIETLLQETMPLILTSRGAARSVSNVLADRHGLPAATRELLIQWLLNGLHFWELKHSGPGHTRVAARRRGSPNDKKKP